VVVHRKGLEDAVLELPWTVISSTPTVVSRPIFISNRPLAPWLTMASLLLSVLLASVWLAVTQRPDLFHWSDNKVTSASQEINL